MTIKVEWLTTSNELHMFNDLNFCKLKSAAYVFSEISAFFRNFKSSATIIASKNKELEKVDE